MKSYDRERKIMERIQHLEEERKALLNEMFAPELDELSPKEPEKVWPQEGDQVHLVTSSGIYQMFRFHPQDPAHQGMLDEGSLAQNREEAEAYKAWIISPITQARRRIEGLDGFNPVGEGCIQSFSSEAATVVITVKGDFKNGGIRFATTEQAEVALSTHEADIRLVLTGES